MALKFHNTLTNQVDEFVSLTAGKATLYTCGPTVYNSLHIGNWAAYIYWDTLVRILIANGYDVVRVMNITDVGHLTSDTDDGEDKLEKGARREGKTAWEVAKVYTDDFMNGIKKLNLVTPTYITKATDYIPDQLNLVRILKQKGLTYQIDDGIYYNTSKFPTYADFAHLNLDSQKTVARIEHNPQKRNQSDFALWKFTPVGEKRDMEWPTPAELVGTRESEMGNRESQNSNNDQKIMGFPGWHLECSAMALSILGNTLDIHTGGIDHIPVHHTNEIAQSEAVTGVRFCNYWLHNNHLKAEGTKISKSLGNGYTLEDIWDKGFSPLDFRMFILQGHYRNEGNFTFDGLQAAKNRLHNWRNIAAIRHQTHDTIRSDEEKAKDDKTIAIYATPHAIIEAIDDDLSTPEALRLIDDVFTHITNTRLDNIDRQALIQLIETIDRTLGLELIDTTPDITDDAKRMVIERNAVRNNKDWAKADELRAQLLILGIIVRDTKEETIWEYRS